MPSIAARRPLFLENRWLRGRYNRLPGMDLSQSGICRHHLYGCRGIRGSQCAIQRNPEINVKTDMRGCLLAFKSAPVGTIGSPVRFAACGATMRPSPKGKNPTSNSVLQSGGKPSEEDSAAPSLQSVESQAQLRDAARESSMLLQRGETLTLYRLVPIAAVKDHNWDLAPSYGEVLVAARTSGDARVVAAAFEVNYIRDNSMPGESIAAMGASTFRNEKLYTVIEIDRHRINLDRGVVALLSADLLANNALRSGFAMRAHIDRSRNPSALQRWDNEAAHKGPSKIERSCMYRLLGFSESRSHPSFPAGCHIIVLADALHSRRENLDSPWLQSNNHWRMGLASITTRLRCRCPHPSL